MVSAYLRRAGGGDSDATAPKALIVPHAGYVYSGPIAAAAYARVAARRAAVRRIVLIGPSHRVYLRGMAVPGAATFRTPLGSIPVDAELKTALLRRDDVIEADAPHALEHSLEVQLPFLQLLFADFTLLPVVLGSASAQQIGGALEQAWGDDATLVLVSSDLSHYHEYATAAQIDAVTSAKILRREPDLVGEQACGAVGINGLLHLARSKGLEVEEIERCNSGDTAGDKSRVVGYGAFAVHETRARAPS
jgi:MEMO1 family protein